MQEKPGKLILILALLLSFSSHSQQVTVNGGFVEDSLMIGQKINYWVTATYPPSLELVFPDSNYTFAPFEFSNKTYFATQLKDDLAFDSTVYTLQSFEIDQVQYLQLKTILLEQDSTVILTPLDSIYLTELAPIVTDSTQLKTNLEYQSVRTKFNYPLLYYIVGGFVVLGIILLLVFGKRIIQYFKIRRIHKAYRVFSEHLDDYINQLKKTPDPTIAEHALSLWKKYLDKLEKVPFSKFTTKEILSLENTIELENPLKSIDRVVYGKRTIDKVFQDFQQIEDFAEERYQQKVREIKYGK